MIFPTVVSLALVLLFLKMTQVLWTYEPLGYIAGFLVVIPVIFFFQNLIVFLTAETALTTHRVLSKVGWISRNISEITLAKIESSSITQGMVGRIFGFGNIVIRGSGGHAATGIGLAEVMRFRAEVQRATRTP